MTRTPPPAPDLAETHQLGPLYQALRKQLGGLSETASSDARVLLANVVARSTSWVLAHPEYELTTTERQRLIRAASQLLAGRPLPYVLGEWPFFGLDFYVSPAALIPRPETELLVEEAAAWLKSNPGRRLVLDAGTGTGCIAIALAVTCPGTLLLGTDISLEALHLARRNSIRHKVEDRIHWVQGDLAGGVGGGLDLICANLPYIPASRLPSLRVYGREPALALDGGRDGMQLIRRLLRDAPRLLSPGGMLLVEMDASQRKQALGAVAASLPEADAKVLPDLAGRDRVLRIELPG